MKSRPSGARIHLGILGLLLIGPLSPARSGSGDSRYAWPLDARPGLTSTFGEYRSGRLHAGIDLKTWGREGFAVRAVADGRVSRIRTSPWGYGRAVYLKLRDGNTAVYAHLSAFAPRLAAVVEAEQDRRLAYSVELFPEETRLPVTRGEVIGFSGSSGVGLPHLHFELRDERERPMNALERGFRVTDTLPPTCRALALLPLSPSALVNGGHEPAILPLTWDPLRRCFVAGDRVFARGRLGVALDAFDQADASAGENRLAAYRLRLLLDDRAIFETTYSSFGYGENHLAELDRNFALARRGIGRFHNLFAARGNRLPLYGACREGDGVLHAGTEPEARGAFLGPGPHLLRAEAQDIAGNGAVAEVEILVGDPPDDPHAPPPSEPDSSALVCTPVYYPDFAVVRIVAARPASTPPRVTVTRPDGGSEPAPVRRIGPGAFEAVWPFDPRISGDLRITIQPGEGGDSEEERVLVLTQQTVTDSGGEIRSVDGAATARFAAGRVYGPLFGRVDLADAVVPAHLPLVGNAYRFSPDDVPFDGRAELILVPPDGFDRSDKLGVYRRSSDGSWSFLGNRPDPQGRGISAEVASFGTFALLMDETRPVVDEIQPPPGGEVHDPRPALYARIRDEGSGIVREEDLAMELDGVRLIVEYDPERDRIAARPRRPLTPGPHRLEVRVRDACGNEARSIGTFVFRRLP